MHCPVQQTCCVGCELTEFNRTASPPLALKVGIRNGRSIAVALNDRIDYFGQDANVAARLQGVAGGNEICISQEVMEAPGVGEIVSTRRVSPDYVHLRGVGEKAEIKRVAIS